MQVSTISLVHLSSIFGCAILSWELSCLLHSRKTIDFYVVQLFHCKSGSEIPHSLWVFCSVITSYLTLCDAMSCNTPDFPFFTISCSILKLKPIESVVLSNYLISSVTPFFCLQSFPALGSFPMSHLFVSGGQSIGALASAPVLPMNIQGWFPLGLTSLISTQSKGLSECLIFWIKAPFFFSKIKLRTADTLLL